MPQPVRKIIFDTDPGVDDAMALLFLKSHPAARVLAVTSVFGNAAVDVTTRNAQFLTQEFGLQAPVYSGATDPIAHPRLPAPAFVHGHDGLGDVGVAEGFQAPPVAAIPAHLRMIELIHAHPHELTVLAVGPMTNLALALEADPSITGLVREVVIMGGAFGYGWKKGNVSPVAEANIRNDPDAADKLLTAPWPVVVVGLDVTTPCVLSTARARDLADRGGPGGQFLWDISRSYEKMYQDRDGLAGCCLHDVAAAIYVVAPELFTTESGPIRAVTEGIAIGQTIQQPDKQSFPPGPWDGLPSQKACIGVDHQGVVDLYVETLVAAARA